MERLLPMLREWTKHPLANRKREVWVEIDAAKVAIQLRDRDVVTGHSAKIDVVFGSDIDQANIDEFIERRLETAFDELAESITERKRK